MRISYPTVILEAIEKLELLEQQMRGTHQADRIRLLRLLKQGTAKSIPACVHVLGL